MIMSSSNPFELTLGLKLSYVPKSLSELIRDLSKTESDEVKLLVLNDQLLKYQEELISVKVFKQDLPQCTLLLIDAVEKLKEEIIKIKIGMGLEAAERCLAKDALATRKRGFEEQQSFLDLNNPSFDQRWTDATHHHHKRQAGLFVPMPRAEEVPMNLNLNAQEEPKLKPLTQSTWRNNRRSWTPQLHAKFVMALHMLGGPEVATPKQIRDHMQIDGLTTNQVKSHLQKYRIIWRSSQYNITE